MAKKKKAAEAEVSPSPSLPKMEDNGKYDFQDLMRAEEIKNDPARLKNAMKHAKAQKAAINSIADLKEHRNKMHMEESES